MLDFSNTFFVVPSLLSFLPFVALGECGSSVCLKKMKTLMSKYACWRSLPQKFVVMTSRRAGTFFSVGCSEAQLLSGDWLKVKFSAYIMAYFLHFCRNVSKFVMSD